MAELTDPRREKFAQLLAADRRSRPKKSRWHKEAGFSGDSGNACVMSELIDILYAVGVIGAISIVVGVATYAIAAITEWWLRK